MKLNPRAWLSFFALFVAMLACIPPQDCELKTIHIQGVVVDEAGQPIEGVQIIIQNDEFTKVELVIETDESGRFNYADLSIFLCEYLNFEIVKKGYVTEMQRYIVASGLLNSLPPFIEITLERSD